MEGSPAKREMASHSVHQCCQSRSRWVKRTNVWMRPSAESATIVQRSCEIEVCNKQRFVRKRGRSVRLPLHKDKEQRGRWRVFVPSQFCVSTVGRAGSTVQPDGSKGQAASGARTLFMLIRSCHSLGACKGSIHSATRSIGCLNTTSLTLFD